jgi:PAS domain S-box-containing protein
MTKNSTPSSESLDGSTPRQLASRLQPDASAAETRTLLEAMLDNSLDLIYFKDLNSRFVRYSRSLSLHFGLFDRTVLIGKTDADCYPAEEARSRLVEEQRVVRTGEPVVGKLEQVVRSDGQPRWLLTTKMPWRDAQGNIIGTFGVSKDVTAFRETESKLAETSSLLETLLENSPDSIYFKDRESRFVYFSKAFTKLFNVPDTKSLKGKTDFDFFTREHAQPAYDDEQNIIRTGQALIGKVEKETHPDGRITWCITTKMPWRDKDGNIIGTFGTSKDITAIKDSEAKLEQVHKELLAASRMAGMAEVATSVLHNVGNVLNSVNVSASLLRDKLEKSRISSLVKAIALLKEHAADLGAFLTADSRGRQLPEFLGEVAKCLVSEREGLLKEITQLDKNIDHIKDIVSMQQNYAKVSGVVESVNVNDLVEDALRMNSGALTRHGVEIVRQLEPTPTEICVDKHKALQILVNLVRNAKYACDESNRPDKRVTMRVARADERVRITVLDNGVGIPPENMTRIFNHGFTTRKEGHGFGLHSGALAARELGGSLYAHSDGVGAGASFTLELPLQPPGVPVIPEEPRPA